MHRGHHWVFRAESYDTMLAWFEDIKNLTEKSGEERNAFVRRHARSVSQGSARSVSSNGDLEEDEADQVPYSANQSMTNEAVREEPPQQRPSPGGRFPSDLQIDRNLHAPLPGSSGSSEVGNDITTASGGLQAFPNPYNPGDETNDDLRQTQPFAPSNDDAYAQNIDHLYQNPSQEQNHTTYLSSTVANQAPPQAAKSSDKIPIERHESTYGEWMAPAAGGAAAGALSAEAYHRHDAQEQAAPPSEAFAQAPQPNQTFNSDLPIFAPVPSGSASLTNSTLPSSFPSSANDEKQSFLVGTEVAPAAISSKPQETGQVFPGVTRQNTDFSVSDLHVPGEYPKKSM
jgi:hypothetical protein